MVSAKWCSMNVNSGYKIHFSSVLGELKELIDARSVSEVREEFGDVLYFIYCWLYSGFGINLPMIGAMGSVNKFLDRLDVWRMIFEYHGLEFSTRYLVNGSNYERPEKVSMALDIAEREQGRSGMYLKFVVVGKLLFETDTHYVTKTSKGTTSWNKQWYRLMPDS